MLSEAPLPDGCFLELCQTNIDNNHLFVISHNVVTNVLTDFIGTVPAGYEVVRTGPSAWNIGPNWHACMRNCTTGPWGPPPFDYMSAWAADAADGGYFYNDSIDGKVLRRQDATGAQTVLYTSTDGGAFTVMTTIGN